MVFQKNRSSNDEKAPFSKAYSNKTRTYTNKKRASKKNKQQKKVKGIESFCVGYGFDAEGEQKVFVQSAFMSTLEIVIMKKPKVLGDASPDWLPTAQLNVKHETRDKGYIVDVPIEYAQFAMPQLIIPPTLMRPVINLPPLMPQFVISPKPMILPQLERSVDGNKGARYKKEEIKKEEPNF